MREIMREMYFRIAPLKKSKSLGFLSKEKFLNGDNVKGKDESMMKSNDEILSHHGDKMIK